MGEAGDFKGLMGSTFRPHALGLFLFRMAAQAMQPRALFPAYGSPTIGAFEQMFGAVGQVRRTG